MLELNFCIQTKLSGDDDINVTIEFSDDARLDSATEWLSRCISNEVDKLLKSEKERAKYEKN